MTDPYRIARLSDEQTLMALEQRKLARNILQAIADAESYAEQRSAWAWFDARGVRLLRCAMDEIERLENEVIRLESER